MSEFNEDGVWYLRRLKKFTSLNHVTSDDRVGMGVNRSRT